MTANPSQEDIESLDTVIRAAAKKANAALEVEIREGPDDRWNPWR